MSALRMFIPITKVDAARRCVFGIATAEKEDRAGEICDYASTKPYYEKWSADIARSTRGKSLGNLRAMHGNIAAGKVTEISFNDEERQIEICAKVVDDAEWAKVMEGVYTGFSQGGTYKRRWTDAEGKSRYTAAPNEISLVDLPCLPEATFEMIKADGTREQRRFGQGIDTIQRLSKIIEELVLAKDDPELAKLLERNGPQAMSEFRDLVTRTVAVLRVIMGVETVEDGSVGLVPDPMSVAAASLGQSPLSNMQKSGDDQSDQDRIQHMHDTSVELGAKCEMQKGSLHEGFEKHFDMLTQTLADVLQRVKNIEEQPLPLPLMGAAKTISKTEDRDGSSQAGLDELLSDPDALSILAIKLAQRKGRSPLR
ncbi:MAG TPA: hypothetical protein VME69_06260 [Methylocella sp.]|nr:hypothetical protein [Methylocella sp.]